MRRSENKWKSLFLLMALVVFLCGCSLIPEPIVDPEEGLRALQREYIPVNDEENSHTWEGKKPGDVGTEISPTEETSSESLTEEAVEDGSLAEDPVEAELDTFPADADGIVRITICGAGDVTLGMTHQQDYSYSFDQMYDTCQDPGYFFANVADYFANDDCTIVNLEGPLTSTTEMLEEKEFIIKGKPEYVHILSAGSVEMAGFSNNHRLDYGQAGFNETLSLLEQENIPCAVDDKYALFETAKGIKVGLVAVHTTCLSDYANGFVKKGIASLREQGADLVVINIHWGIERNNYPEDYQRTMGKNCIDWGADLVLGSHPHVLQGVEVYKNRCIIYSLANFCFGGNRNPVDKDTMIFKQTFEFKDGQLLDTLRAQVIPCSVTSDSSRNNYQPTPSEGAQYTRILNRIKEFSTGFGTEIDEDGSIIVG